MLGATFKPDSDEWKVMALVVTRLPPWKRPGWILLLAFIGFGLATIAGAYMERVSAAIDPRRRAAAMQAIAAIDATARSLEFNPGELLALQALLARLGTLSTQA